VSIDPSISVASVDIEEVFTEVSVEVDVYSGVEVDVDSGVESDEDVDGDLEISETIGNRHSLGEGAGCY